MHSDAVTPFEPPLTIDRGSDRGLKPPDPTRMLALVKTSAPARAVRSFRGASRRLAALTASLRVGAVALLLVFHAILFYTHLVGGRLFEPAVAMRWGIGIVLMGLLLALRRIGVPLFWGRRALAVWVLVALLHVGAAMPATATSLSNDDPVSVTLSLVVLPPVFACVASLLLLAMFARTLRLPQPAVRLVRRDGRPRARSTVLPRTLVPRAPPVPVF